MLTDVFDCCIEAWFPSVQSRVLYFSMTDITEGLHKQKIFEKSNIDF